MPDPRPAAHHGQAAGDDPAPAPGAVPGVAGPEVPRAAPRANAPYGLDGRTGVPFSDRSRAVAGLLQVLLAPFAAGRLYLGDTKLALTQIVVSWATCGLGAVWPLVDGIRLLVTHPVDHTGRPLRP
ncbi:NINE protein [Propioniciclava soli]|uniref:NINE protein n=1 Tax=Propioniciclava soli TaxID=2775081 RepID=A0ABZ3C3Z6_9ACTN